MKKGDKVFKNDKWYIYDGKRLRLKCREYECNRLWIGGKYCPDHQEHLIDPNNLQKDDKVFKNGKWYKYNGKKLKIKCQEYDCEKSPLRVFGICYCADHVPEDSRKDRPVELDKNGGMYKRVMEVSEKYNCEFIRCYFTCNGKYMCEFKCLVHNDELINKQYSNLVTKYGDHLCNTCSKEDKLDDVQKLAEKNGGKCLNETYGTNRKRFTFICDKDHKFQRSKNEIIKGYWCQECTKDKMESMSREDRLDMYGSNTEIGDDNENFVKEIIQDIYKCEVTGPIGDIFDIIVLTDDGIKRGIQVKTINNDNNSVSNLTKKKTDKGKYPDDTLMVFLKPDKSIFYLAYFKDIFSGKPTFRVKKGDKRAYEDTDKFKSDLLEMCKNAVDVSTIPLEDRFSPKTLTEYNSRQRVIEFSNKYSLSFEIYYTHASSIDVLINGHAIQMKSSSKKHGNGYNVGLMKNGGRGEHVPYHIDDGINFFLIEVGDYVGEFCLLPIEILAKEGYIETDSQKGKKAIKVFHPSVTSRGNFTKDPKYWGENILKFLQT